MCEPTTIMLAISAVSAVVSHDAQSKAAKATQESINIQESLQQADLARQAEQQREAGAQQMNEHARQSAKDMALFDAITGEYGGGVSADRGRAAMGLQKDEGLATIGANARNAAGENSMASLATSSQAQARLASISQPSALGTALQIGGAYATKRVTDQKLKTP